MDAVRFGRALGFGARHAVKTLTTAVDAAAAQNPSSTGLNSSAKTGPPAPPQPSSQTSPSAAQTVPQPSTAAVIRTGSQAHTTPAARAAETAAETIVRVRETRQGLRRGSRRFGEAVWRPFVRLSGVLWLEVMGVFFGIFALFGLTDAWRLRGQWHMASAQHRQLLGAVAMLALFGYFCGSSFVRARRRERQR